MTVDARPSGTGQVARWERMRSQWRTVAAAAAMAAGYVLTAKLGLLVASANPLTTAVWPPTGFAVAGLLLGGRRVWPGIALAAFLVNRTSGATTLEAVAISVGNTLAPLVAVTLLRARGAGHDLTRLKDVVELLVLGPAAMVISASLGTLTLLVTGYIGPSRGVDTWLVWWVGDAMGVIVVAPFLLSLRAAARPDFPCSRCRYAESAALLLTLTVTCQLVFVRGLPVAFLVFPYALWAALRLPQPVVTATNLVVAGSSVWMTVRGGGPFHLASSTKTLLDLQAFNACVTAASLVLSAAVRERGLAHRQLEAAAAGLEEAVEKRTAKLATTNRLLAQEIAARLEAERVLQQSEERYRSIYERATEGIIQGTLDGTRFAVNPAMARMLGYASPDDLRTRVRSVAEVLVDPAAGIEINRLLRAHGEVRGYELELRRAGGDTFWTSVTARTVGGTGGGPEQLEGIVVDVTERRSAHEALIAAYEGERQTALELERLNRMKDVFFANISHEFRTPITLTLGPLEQVMTGRCGRVAAEVSAHLETARRSQHRLLRLVDQILDLARMEQGAMELTVSPVPDVNRLVAEQAVHFEAVAALRGVHIALRLDPRLSGVDLWLDQDKFDVVVGNLLGNALKHTEGGEVVLGTSVRDGALVLEVEDSGTGIHEDDIDHVFERFWQGSRSAQAGSGTGLGLAIVKEIVALHGGEVSVGNRPEGGVRFTVRLPLGTSDLPADVRWGDPAEPEPGPMRAPADVEMDGAGTAEEMNRETETAFDTTRAVVLYVEDVHDLRVHVRALLGDEWNVYVAADGVQGLELARRYRPDLVVADEMLPGLSGMEMLRELRSDPELAPTPVVFITALTDSESRVGFLEGGADDYLAKPFHADELRARIRNLLRARRQERSLADTNRRLEMRIEEQMGELVRTGELRRFLPGPVGDRLLAGGMDAEPALARGRITVLVADIPGFDDLAERLDPEDLSELANEYLTEVTAAAVAHGGVVDHLPGGELMVLFGVPDGPESKDHPWSAAATAVMMRDRLAEVAVRCRQRGLTTDLRLRAALNTGYATVGVLGSSLLRTYTAIGSVVSVAATLRDRATPGQILCGATTRGALADRARMRARDPIPRGTGGPPIEAFELLELGRGDEGGSYSAPELIGRPAWHATVDSAADGRVFRREGSYWTVAYEGSVVRLKDSKGLRYLAHLLANPGVEVHVLQLVNLDREGNGAGEMDPATARGLGLAVTGDVEGILDDRARSSYRDRLTELREELEEATGNHDLERAARAQAELDAVMEQLAEATGLAGRDRRMPTDAERARVNITKRIRGAIAIVGEHHPSLERHLRATVRTGAFCSYTPEPARDAAWSV